jgi:hypothetical protein
MGFLLTKQSKMGKINTENVALKEIWESSVTEGTHATHPQKEKT